MKPLNRILLVWICGTVALSFSEAPYRVSAGSEDVTHHNSTDVQQVATGSTEEDSTATCATNSSRWGAENLFEVLNSWKFSPEEEVSLMELKERLVDIDHWKNDPAELARFVKEHNFDVDKAERMFRGMISWRLENDVDGFMEHYGEPPDIFHYAPIFLLKGLDKDGDPIFVQRIGKFDAWGIHQRLGEAAMIEANRFVQEMHTSRDIGIPKGWRWQTEYYEPLMGRRVTQFTILIDLDGLGPQLLRPALFSFLQTTSRIAQDHYPGLAKRLIFVRAPRIFKMAWKVAVRFFDPRVHHKFIFSNHYDYLEVLSEYMDLEVLPAVIFPEGSGTQMPGFFEKIHMEGGPLPSSSDDDPTPPHQPPSVSPEMATTS